jgi:hypothetical protein
MPDDIDGEAMLDALLDTPPAVILRGEAATAAGRAMLEQAGFDVAAFEARMIKAGRPRLDGEPTGVGGRVPRLNVVITPDVEFKLNEIASARGVKRSQVVRDALEAYLAAS